MILLQRIADISKAKAHMAFTGSARAMFRTVSAAIATRKAINLGSILQLVSIVLGYTLVTLFAFMNALSSMTFLTVLAYQGIWTVLVALLPNMRKL